MTAEQMKFVIRFATAIGAILATGLVLSPAISAEQHAHGHVVVTGEPLPTRIVPIGDLNLRMPKDRQRLQWRISGAVRSLCGTPTRQPLEIEARYVECRHFAFASAKPQVDAAIARAQYAANGNASLVLTAR